MSFRKETIDAFGSDYEPPNYKLWLNKSCWDVKEICYLANGFNPAHIPGGMVIDLSSGEIEPAPINYGAVVLAVELMDVVKRGIESGELMPGIVGGKCFEPVAVITYLNQKGVVLPGELLAALPKSLELEKKGFPLEIVEELDSRTVSQLEPTSAPYESPIAVSTKPQGGRPRTIDKKAELLRHMIAQFEIGAGKQFASGELPGSSADLLDACQRFERSINGSARIFNTTEDTIKMWLRAGGFVFRRGRPIKGEEKLWTGLVVKTVGITKQEVFRGYFSKCML